MEARTGNKSEYDNIVQLPKIRKVQVQLEQKLLRDIREKESTDTVIT